MTPDEDEMSLLTCVCISNKGHISISMKTYCVTNLEARAGLESKYDLSIQASSIKQEIQLLWDAHQLQLHFRANFLLSTKFQSHVSDITIQLIWILQLIVPKGACPYCIGVLNELNNIPRITRQGSHSSSWNELTVLLGKQTCFL